MHVISTTFSHSTSRPGDFTWVSFTLLVAGAKDLLSAMGVTSLPDGVTRLRGREDAYHIHQTANLNVPTSRVFSSMHGFPRDFSVIATVRPKKDNQGYLLAVTDLLGFVKLAVQVGTYPVLEYADEKGKPGEDSPHFAVELSDDKWHQFAYSIKGQTATLYLDCNHVIQKDLDRNSKSRIPSSTVISLGKTFAQRKQHPTFQVCMQDITVMAYTVQWRGTRT